MGVVLGGGEVAEAKVDDGELAELSQLAVKNNLAVMHCADEPIERLEPAIIAKANRRPEYQYLFKVREIGKVLSLTIALETGM